MSDETIYHEHWIQCLNAIEYTLSSHGNEDWLREWIEGDEDAQRELAMWVLGGKKP